MAPSYTLEIAQVLAFNPRDRAAIRTHVLRLARSLKERTASGDASSLEFVKASVNLIKRIDRSTHAASAFEGMAAAVPYLFAHGEFNAALTASHLMCESARRLDHKDLIRRAETFTGIIQKNLGNVADALVHYQRALYLAREIGDLKGEASTLNNLSGLFAEIGLCRETETCVENLTRMSGTDFAQYRCGGYHNLATLYSRMGRREDALRLACKSLAEWDEAPEIHDCYARAMREASFIFMAIDFSGPNELEKHLECCQQYAMRCGTRPADCFYRLARGVCMVHDSQLIEGISVLNNVLDEAEHLQHPGLIEDALASLSWAHEVSGEPAEALRYVRRFIENLVKRRHACLQTFDRGPSANGEQAIHSDLLPLKYKEASLEVAALRAEARSRRAEMLHRLAMTASLRDDPSGMHGHRVGMLSSLLAGSLGWSSDRCYELEIAARLHDIGKTAVPDHILFTAAPLKQAERDFIKSHPDVGSSLLSDASDPESRLAADIALFHHERWNGTGYPKGISGARIPLSARIVAIADVFDALTHGRPYAEPWPIDKALGELAALAGSHFDPQLVNPFIELVSRLIAQHGDVNAYLEATAQTLPFLAARKKIEAMILDRRSELRTPV